MFYWFETFGPHVDLVLRVVIVIVLIPDHCISIYFPDPSMNQHSKQITSKAYNESEMRTRQK